MRPPTSQVSIRLVISPRLMLEALRDGGERTVTGHYEDRCAQMATHMRLHHGKSLDDPNTFEELARATMRWEQASRND